MQDAVLTQRALLTLSGISKRYGGVRALEGVDFACERGKIHAVLGENGAGKSMLIKIIAGVVQPDAGGMPSCASSKAPGSPRPTSSRALSTSMPRRRPRPRPVLSMLNNLVI